MYDTPTHGDVAIYFTKLENVSCEYDRLNDFNSTLQAAWYIYV